MGGDPRRPLTNSTVRYQPSGWVTAQQQQPGTINPLEALLKLIMTAKFQPRGQNPNEP